MADVSETYLALRALDLELEIAKRTRDVATDSLRLTEARRASGVASGLDVRQAEQLLFTATGQIASLEREIAQAENALSLLLGQAPGEVPRGRALEAFEAPPSVPAGLPSALLERRPMLQDEAPAPKPKALPWETPTPIVFSPEDEKLRASLPFSPAIAMDPIDGGKISIRATTPIFEYKGKIYYFTNEENRRAFAANPEQYLKGGYMKL